MPNGTWSSYEPTMVGGIYTPSVGETTSAFAPGIGMQGQGAGYSFYGGNWRQAYNLGYSAGYQAGFQYGYRLGLRACFSPFGMGAGVGMGVGAGGGYYPQSGFTMGYSEY